MDLYVEKQCIDQMKAGEASQLLLLFDANFNELYRYVARRISKKEKVEEIVRLTFLDALGQIQNTPTDISYLVWLYSLAKPRVWDYIAKLSFPDKKGLIGIEKNEKDDKKEEDFVARADRMIKKLSLEEREILRLKFFEEVTDGDVMAILEFEEGKIGPRIYQVLKRAHLLLFGEREAKKGVYFGELSGFFEIIREMEKIEIPDIFKLSLKTDLANRIEKKNFAVEGQVIKAKIVKEYKKFPAKGSDDLAKIFVKAAAEIKEEEEQKRTLEEKKFERKERFYDFIDKWKAVLMLIPVVLFVWIVAFVVMNVIDFDNKVERGYPTICDVGVIFEGNFSDMEKFDINKGISDRLCEHFEVKSLLITRVDDGIVELKVDVKEAFLEYRFVKKFKEWRIKRYAKTFNSDKQPRQV